MIKHYQTKAGSTSARFKYVLYVYLVLVMTTRFVLVVLVVSASDSLPKGIALLALHKFPHLRERSRIGDILLDCFLIGR